MSRVRNQHRNPLRRLIFTALAISLGIANGRADDRQERIRAAAFKIDSAVVSIRPIGIVGAPIAPPVVPPFFRFGRPPLEREVLGVGPSGSGLIVDAQRGLVLTSASVVRGASRVQIRLRDGSIRESRRVASDDSRDNLALIEFDPGTAELSQAQFSDLKSLQLGDAVLAVGRTAEGALRVSAGIVAEIRDAGAGSELAPIVTDALVARETAGGPLLGPDGLVVGICQLENPPMVGEPRAGFQSATSAAAAKRALDDLSAGGARRRGYLGVVLGNVPEGLGPGGGVLVSGVAPGSPAAEAGVEPGDRILSVNDRPVTGAPSLLRAVDAAPVGSELTLRIDRGGLEIEVKARTAEVPQSVLSPSRPPIRSEPVLKPEEEVGEPSEVEAPSAVPSNPMPESPDEPEPL